MRLTLRTLLAYLDDILDAEDSREISLKIEESDFAKNLMHRTRDVVRRLRLAAPSIGERGQGFDPNTVAEYLDNTLPSERVPDFEKVCLESDVQLAEVASCHQILTMVLGEPAEVAPAARERMYDLPALLAAQAVEHSQPAAEPAQSPTPVADSGAAVGGVADDAKLARPKPTVPDYLREPAPPRRRVLPSLGAVVILGVLAVLVLAALGQFEPGSRLATLLSRLVQAPEASNPPEVATPTAAKVEPPTVKPEPAPAEAKATPEATPTVAKAAAPGAADKTAKLPAAPLPTDAKPVPVVVVGPGASGAKPEAPVPAPPAGKPAPSPDLVAKLEPRQPPAAPGVEPKPTAPSPAMQPANNLPANPLRSPGGPEAGKPEARPSVATEAPKPLPAEAHGEAAPMPPERLGRFVLDRQVLLQYDRATGNWMRMGPQAVLNSSLPILSLPSYQPILFLTVGATVQLVGDTQLELLPTDSQGTPGLRLSYGRVVARAVGETKARLRLQVGERVGTVTFKNADSTLGISMARARTPGTNPEEQPGMLMADLFAVSGDFTWDEGGAKPPVPLTAPSMLRVDADPLLTPTVMAELPKWLVGDETSWLDRRASPVLEQEIKLNRPVSLSLRELTNHRREEVAWLAARSLGCLDEFVPMVTALNMPDQKAVWEDYLRSLQLAVTRGRESAAKVRQAFEQRYPNHAANLYRMLWGYTPQELESGQGATLVGYLEHELLVYRVMAYHNLEKLTGLKFAYRAQDSLTKRQPAVSRWKERLQNGLFFRPAEKPRKPENKPEKPATLNFQ